MKKLNKLIISLTAICSLSINAQTIPAYVPTSNLLAWYSFNSNANDLSGNGNNGTVNGATLSADRFGIPNSAYAFNGSSSYIDLDTSIFNIPQIYSISCWSKFNSTSFSYLFGQATNGELSLSSDGSGNVVIWNKLNSGGSVSVLATIPDLTNWHHLVSIFNNVTKTLKLYIDNIAYSTTIPPGVDIAPFTGRALLGRQSNLAANFFNGKLDDIGFWNKELTPCEINQLYNASILPTPTVSASTSNSVICVGGSAILTASTTASTYTWNTGATTMTVSVSPTITSTYTLTGTNTLSCIASAVVTVTVNALPIVSATTSNSLICVGNSAILTASTSATSYTWNTGATTMSVSVSPTVTSTYTVSVSNAAACVNTTTVMVTVNACASINEYDDSHILTIFPNPAKTEINITSDLNYYSLFIVNSIGQVMLKKEKSNTVSVEGLSNGVYFIQLLDKENKIIANKKFIKE
jgi:hypothetical protein